MAEPTSQELIELVAQGIIPGTWQDLPSLGIEDIWLAMSEIPGAVLYVEAARIFQTENFGPGTELLAIAGENMDDLRGKHVRVHTWSENVRALVERLLGGSDVVGQMFSPPLRVTVTQYGRVLSLR